MEKKQKNGHRDLKYKVLSVRLSDEVIEELKNRRIYSKSWNLLFKDLLRKNSIDASTVIS